jgi:TM2 domain-containing membrane protein YozV
MHQPPKRGSDEGWDSADLMPPIRKPASRDGAWADRTPVQPSRGDIPGKDHQIYQDGAGTSNESLSASPAPTSQSSQPPSFPPRNQGMTGGVSPRPMGTRPTTRSATFGRDAEEVSHVLTQVAINLRRGETAGARTVLLTLLQSQPRSAAAYEALGDVELADRSIAAAGIAFRKALEIEPGRPTAELKLARAALRGGADKRIATIGVAYAGIDLATAKPGNSKKNAAIAVVGSLVVPGIGQIINAQYIKGVVVIVLALFFGAVFFSSIDVPSVKQQLLAGMTGKSIATMAAPQLPPAVWICLVALIVVWLYSIIDAGISARGQADSGELIVKSEEWRVKS